MLLLIHKPCEIGLKFEYVCVFFLCEEFITFLKMSLILNILKPLLSILAETYFDLEDGGFLPPHPRPTFIMLITNNAVISHK